MTDYLVKLYDLPGAGPAVRALADQNITVRRARTHERSAVVSWVEEVFGRGWADECRAAFSNHPVSCFVAVQEGALLGFACHDVTCNNFFGPTGVSASHRNKGIGKALLLTCLHTMAAQGYAYAVIGGAGPGSYYEKAVGAVAIDGSDPGVYRDCLSDRILARDL